MTNEDTAERLLITEDAETRDEWILATRRLLGDMWQALLESIHPFSPSFLILILSP